MSLPCERVGVAAGLVDSQRGVTSTIFEEMSALAVRHGAINLGQGFPDTDGPEEMLHAARQAIVTGNNQYATIAGLPVLREAIAGHQQRFYGIEVSSDQVTVTAGASEALSASIAALVNPGDEVIIFEPYYDLYPAAIAQAGGIIKTVPLLPPTFEPDMDALASAFTEQTAMVVVNDPHNPTGAVLSEVAKQRIVDLATTYDAFILHDAVYEHLLFDGRTFEPFFTYPKAFERTLFISAISKTHSATGWRIGWMVGPQALIEKVRLSKAYFSHSTAAPLQIGAAAGLGLDDIFYQDFINRYSQQRDILLEGLADTPFSVVPPAGTFFAVADAGALIASRGLANAHELALDMVQHAGVAVIPLTAFAAEDYQVQIQDWVRFAFCKRPEVLYQAIKRLQDYCLQL